MFGPVLFNIFINDLFEFIKNSKLHNYAYYNAVSTADRVLSKLVANLAEDSLMLIKWFAGNHVKANPDKFQAMAGFMVCVCILRQEHPKAQLKGVLWRSQ